MLYSNIFLSLLRGPHENCVMTNRLMTLA